MRTDRLSLLEARGGMPGASPQDSSAQLPHEGRMRSCAREEVRSARYDRGRRAGQARASVTLARVNYLCLLCAPFSTDRDWYCGQSVGLGRGGVCAYRAPPALDSSNGGERTTKRCQPGLVFIVARSHFSSWPVGRWSRLSLERRRFASRAALGADECRSFGSAADRFASAGDPAVDQPSEPSMLGRQLQLHQPRAPRTVPNADPLPAGAARRAPDTSVSYSAAAVVWA